MSTSPSRFGLFAALWLVLLCPACTSGGSTDTGDSGDSGNSGDSGDSGDSGGAGGDGGSGGTGGSGACPTDTVLTAAMTPCDCGTQRVYDTWLAGDCTCGTDSVFRCGLGAGGSGGGGAGGSGGTGGVGGAGGVGGDGGAGGTGDGGCRRGSDCDQTAGEYCAPVERPLVCGACMPGPSCTTDEDCTTPGDVCDGTGLPSQCPPCEVSCVPGCTSDDDCLTGYSCGATSRCEPTPCTTDGDCPAQFECDTEGGSVCQRLVCVTDNDCPAGGFCVVGRCHPEMGECVTPVP